MSKRKNNKYMSKEKIISTIITIIVLMLLAYIGDIIYEQESNSANAKTASTNYRYTVRCK